MSEKAREKRNAEGTFTDDAKQPTALRGWNDMNTPDFAPNQRIARLMGWTRFGKSSGRISSGKALLGNWKTQDYGTPPADRDKPEDDQAFEPVPNYFSPDLPIGERLKMWEKLTEEEMLMLIWCATAKTNELKVDYSERYTPYDLIDLSRFLLSPEFPSTFLRVVEGKG